MSQSKNLSPDMEASKDLKSQFSVGDLLAHKRRSQFQLFWEQYRRHIPAMISTLILVFLFTITLLAKWVMPYNPEKVDISISMGIPQKPTLAYILGTDELGRDILSRVISGARISLSVGFVAVGVSLTIGLILGSIAGFVGGSVDNLIMRIADIFLSMPTFFLILTVNAFLKPSVYNIMVVIGLFNWMGVARLVRGEFLRLKEQDFVTAARAVGNPAHRLVLKHLLPNSLAPIIVSATLAIPNAILTESALSYLGLGIPPPQASWGSMLNASKIWLDQAWWMWVPPGVLISLTVLAFNFIGDAVRDAWDPLSYR
jgi:peptide/nickel transport system permease protein